MHILSRYAITFEKWFIFATFDFQAVNMKYPYNITTNSPSSIATHASSLKTPPPHPKEMEVFIENPFSGLRDSSFV